MSPEIIFLNALEKAVTMWSTPVATHTLQLQQAQASTATEIKLYFTCVLLVGCVTWLFKSFRELVQKQTDHELRVQNHLTSCSKAEKKDVLELPRMRLQLNKVLRIESDVQDKYYDRYLERDDIPVEDIPDLPPDHQPRQRPRR